MSRAEPDPGVAWMLAFQAGDDLAFDKVVEEYQGVVFGMLRKILGPHSMVEDLAQETFIRVWRARDRYRPRGRFTTWLYRISFNLALNRIRDDKRQAVASIQETDSPGGGIPDPVPDAAVEALGRADWEVILDRALAALPENQRAALVLQHYEGLDLPAIGEVLGIGPKAVKSLLHRGREKLREHLASLRNREND